MKPYYFLLTCFIITLLHDTHAQQKMAGSLSDVSFVEGHWKAMMGQYW